MFSLSISRARSPTARIVNMATLGKLKAATMLRAFSVASCRCRETFPRLRATSALPSNAKRSFTTSARKLYGGDNGAAAAAEEKEYAFEVHSSNFRYGPGVTREIGMDLANLKARKVCVVTDKKLASLPGMNVIHESLKASNVQYEVYDSVRIEPTDHSFRDAIEFARRGEFDAFVAFGGGSAMDTCKAANLFSSKPDGDLFDYIPPPLGKGLLIDHKVFPMIAIPTTSGTGSESTTVAVFDFEEMKLKLCFFGNQLRPQLALIDPLNTLTLPSPIAANTGFDVLCHAIESMTVLPYNVRTPRPPNPKDRPIFQGRNAISDVWAREVLRIMKNYFKRAVKNADDQEARFAMQMAANFAGIGFGSAGIHLCHVIAHGIAPQVKDYKCREYAVDYPIIPHGLSVVLASPAVFDFTASGCPELHLEAAELLGADVTGVKLADSGRILADTIRGYMQDTGVDNGYKAIGFTRDNIPDLVNGSMMMMPTMGYLSPRAPTPEDFMKMFEQSLTVY